MAQGPPAWLSWHPTTAERLSRTLFQASPASEQVRTQSPSLSGHSMVRSLSDDEPGDFSREVVKHHDGHGFLGALVTHTLANIPFENLSLHDSPTHAVSIHPDTLFQKIIRADMGRGGYCLENNVFLGTVLQSLGFDVMSVGARINRMGKGGVGNEDGGPPLPLKLIDGKIKANTVATPQQAIRLRHDAIAENEHQNVKLWIFERRNNDNAPWVPMYCFEDNVCFLPQDLEVLNYFTSTHRTSVFT
ncbi:hypothetical protein LTR49_027626 [Elasticomyces elasticus]|nr:hypothetical protein LTR49_027626 [Elasticomyces elasticus]